MNTQTISTTKTEPNDREALIEALSAWIRQRPGLEYGNYASHWSDKDGRRAYFSESRTIRNQGTDAKTLLRAISWRDSITYADIIKGFRAFSGRLTYDGEKRKLDYCTGQYWPTEYRRAVIAVLVSVLWDYHRADYAKAHGSEYTGYREFIQKWARREFGRRIASYFD